MPRVNLTINLDGTPLRRTWVQAIGFGLPIADYMTDDNGEVRDEQGNQGIDALFATADIRVNCQNSVVRMLDGAFPIPIHIGFDVAGASDGAVIDVPTVNRLHFRILRQCIDVYDTVFRPMPPFSTSAAPDFPLGRKPQLGPTFSQSKRIEVVFPDGFLEPAGLLSFVEPKSVATGFPLLHLKSADLRLFGTPGIPATLTASEIAHGLHFSLLPVTTREHIQNNYLGFIFNDLLNSGGGTHFANKETTPMVAFLEALDHFSHRFHKFVSDVRSNRLRSTTINLLRSVSGSGFRVATAATVNVGEVRGLVQSLGFIPETVSPTSAFSELVTGFIEHEASTFVTFGAQLARRRRDGAIEPNPSTLTILNRNGTSVEGAVYGALFLEFARRVGLPVVMQTIIESQAVTYGGYRQFVDQNHQQLKGDLDATSGLWQM